MEHLLDCTITKVYEAKNKEGEPIEGKGDYGPWKLYTFYTDKTAKDKFSFMWSGKKPILTEGLKVKHIEYDEEKTGKYVKLNVKKLELPDKSTPEAMPNAKEDMGSIPKATNNKNASFYVAYASQMWCAMVSRLPEEIVNQMVLSQEAKLVTEIGLNMMGMVARNIPSEPQTSPPEESKPESKGKGKAKVSTDYGGPSRVICDNDDEAGHKGIEVIPMYCKTQCKLRETCATAKQLREME